MNGRHGERANGFTLVEVTLALTLLSVGVLALAGSLGSVVELGDDRVLEVRKTVQLQNVMIVIRGVDFDLIPLAFGPGSGNEQFWCDEAGGIWFADPGDSVATGSIEIFDEEFAVPASFANSAGGMDLNANGFIDFGAVTDYQVLPIRIQIDFPNNPGAPPEIGDYLLRP